MCHEPILASDLLAVAVFPAPTIQSQAPKPKKFPQFVTEYKKQ